MESQVFSACFLPHVSATCLSKEEERFLSSSIYDTWIKQGGFVWHPLIKNDGTKCPWLFPEAIGGSVAMGQRIHRNCGVSSVGLEIAPSQISLQCSWGVCGVVLSAVSTVMVPNSGSTEFLQTTATQNSFHHCFGLIWLLWTLETFECCVSYKTEHYTVKILIDNNKNLYLYFLLLVV